MENFLNNKPLNDAIKEMEKKFGKQTFEALNQDNIGVISSGSISLNDAIGIGGFPKGRIVEIYGNESSGKTTIALQTAKECINNDGNVAYIDVENALNPKYISSLGIDLNKLLIAHPDNGEQAFALIDALLKTNMINLIVVDSVAALVPKQEIEGNIQDQSIGLHARMMSKGLRMIQGTIAKSDACVIFINQIREKVGVMFGNPEITTGGRALRFFSSLRLDVRKTELLKEGNEVLGIKSKISVIKNKMAPPFKTCFIDIFFDKGFDYFKEIISFAIDYEIITKSGTWFYFNEIKLGQGKSQSEKYINDHPDLFKEIKEKVLNKLDEKNNI